MDCINVAVDFALFFDADEPYFSVISVSLPFFSVMQILNPCQEILHHLHRELAGKKQLITSVSTA